MADTATYDLIASQTLASAASSITFSSIAASWTDLRVVLTCTTAFNSENIIMRYNSDTASNYSRTVLYGNGSSAIATSGTNNTSMLFTDGNQSSSTIPEVYIANIFSYNGSTYKTTLLNASMDNNGSGSVNSGVFLWRSTSAITAISLAINAGTNFNTGTTANLYGIKAA